jgi:hypothetical protein
MDESRSRLKPNKSPQLLPHTAYGEDEMGMKVIGTEDPIATAKCRTIEWWAFVAFVQGNFFANAVYFVFYL